MRVVAVIVAGGKSRRMGREKAFIELCGAPILSRILSVIAPQVDDVVINANGDPSRFHEFRRHVIADIDSDPATPLAGLHAALRHGAGNRFDAVLTVTSDAPFLPPDLVTRLEAAAGRGAVASSDGQIHYMTGLWPVHLLATLEAAMSNGVMRAQDWVRLAGAAQVEWPAEPFDPFFNINTPEDLAEAERIAAEFSP
jgi:molybdenum cofactor guanylyltransferase